MKILTNWGRLFRLPCLFHQLTGLYCPGCGGTRAVRYLLQGNLLQSFRYHPIVLYGAAVLTAELLSLALAKLLKRPNLYIGREETFLYIGLAIVLINWLVKNICLVLFGLDLLSP